MKLVFQSATIAVLQGTVYADTSSFDIPSLAVSVDSAYKPFSGKSYLRKTSALDEECAFGYSEDMTIGADAGILGCKEGFICTKDKSSSLGGRCVSTTESKARELQSCVKCDGYKA